MTEQKDNLTFSEPIAEMFSDIVINDEELFKIMILFSKATQERQAVSISMIVDNVVVNRRVAVPKGRRHIFEETETNIAKGAAIKAVEQLEKMSLIWAQPVARSFIYYLTVRGEQVARYVLQHYSKLRANETQQDSPASPTFSTSSKPNQ